MEKLTRRQFRYICFRLANEALGGAAADKTDRGVMKYVDKVKAHVEGQEDFGGWDKFGKTWDMDTKAHLVVVLLQRSNASAWNDVLKKEAKTLKGQESADDTQPEEDEEDENDEDIDT